MNKCFVRSFVRTYKIKSKPMRERIDCLVDFINFIAKYERQYEIIGASYDSQFDLLTVELIRSPSMVYDVNNGDILKDFIVHLMSYFGLSFDSCSYGLITTATNEKKRQFTIGLIQNR